MFMNVVIGIETYLSRDTPKMDPVALATPTISNGRPSILICSPSGDLVGKNSSAMSAPM